MRGAIRGTVRRMVEPLQVAGLLRVGDESAAVGDAMRRAARRGDMRRVHRGAYVGAEHWKGLGPEARHRVEVRAALAAARSDVLVSHQSAAVVWGLPVVGAPLRRVHLTFVGASGGVSRGAVSRHVTSASPPESMVDGIRVTSAGRTVVDLARAAGLLAGVVAADAALRAKLVTPGQLAEELEAAGKGRGVRVARDVVAFADGLSESPGESLSRVRMRQLGLPGPVLQREFSDHVGFVGRVDFWWEDVRVVGEFDGRAKYEQDGDIEAERRRLWEEKLRENRLRATGATVARWTWADAWAGAPMAAALLQAGVRPSVRRPTHRS